MDFRFEEITSQSVWDEFWENNGPESLFQGWLWGEVEKKAGHMVRRYGLYNGDELVAIAQIFIVRARRGAYLHVRQGPIFRRGTTGVWTHMLENLRRIAKTSGAWFIRVSPLIEDTPEHNNMLDSLHLLPSPIHEVDAERCWVLDINKNKEDLLAGMRKTTRYEIRRAEKIGIEIRKSTEVADLDKFYSLYEETSKRHGFVTHMSITEEFTVFQKQHAVELYLGYFEGKLLASAIILYYGNQAIYHHGASISNKIPASYAIQWQAIQEAKKRGLPLYNLYGIAPENKPNHPWNGLTLFKKGFGGREVVYTHSRDLPLTPLYVIPKTIEAVRKKLRGYG